MQRQLKPESKLSIAWHFMMCPNQRACSQATITAVFATNYMKLNLSEFMRSNAAKLLCSRKDRKGSIVCFNMFIRTFSSKNCVFTGKHDQKCRSSSDSELYCNFNSFCSLEGTKSIKKESKYMISNTLRLSRHLCNLKGRNLLNRGNTTTYIADKVILGKEISKSVKCFQKNTNVSGLDDLEFYIVAYK